jgi:hypothetical protein
MPVPPASSPSDPQEPPTDATPRTRAPRALPLEKKAEPVPTTLRLGVDFGTSTTQVAYYLEGRDPQLLRLEDVTDYMPSYFAMDGTEPRFGVVAQNLPENVHSVKPMLVDDAEIPGFGHPSRITFLMLAEVVRRTILRLREQRLIPDEIDRLEIATNLGCTPRFELDARLLLRDVARRAGLHVDLATLVEEPVAAAYEVMLSGIVSDGRVLVVDMGGGTLDIAMIRISDAARSFELFASGGYIHAGDRFTEVIAERMTAAVQRMAFGSTLARADTTLIWQRAEGAKQTLSVRRSAIIPLGGIASLIDESITITAEEFRELTRQLRVLVEHDVATVYRLSRLVLDRGGEYDPAPGTIDFDEPTKGKVRNLSQVGLRDDAQEHIDAVVLVGGATNMPMIGELFRSIFGDRVIEPEIVGIDRSAVVALGLSRPKPPGMTSLRHPSWGVSAVFATDQVEVEIPLYEPFAPTFQIRQGHTSVYTHGISAPGDARTVALAFRPIGGGAGTRWPFINLPYSGGTFRFEMDLFGAIRLLHDETGDILRTMSPPPRAPWSPAEGAKLPDWLPPWRAKPKWWEGIPVWDPRNDK